MIQISPQLIRPTQRRVSFDEADLQGNGASTIERLLSSSPDRLDENPLEEIEQKILEEKKELERERGKSELIPIPAGDSPGGEDLEPEEAEGDKPEGGAKPEGKTKTVKFGVAKAIPSSAPSPSVFTKEVVEKKKADLPFSLITKSLLDSGLLNQQQRGSSKSPRAPQALIKVYLEVGRPSIKVSVNELCKVFDVIEMVLEKYNADCKETPSAFPPPASNYELRMLDDDDGSPDFEMPALENSRDIRQYGVAAVAMVKKGQGAKSELMMLNMEGDGPAQDEKSARFFVRVHTEDKLSYVLKTTRETPLRDLISLLAKKKQVDLDDLRPELYNFVYLKTLEMDGLDLKLKVGELESDNLMLLRKVRSVGISPSLLQQAPAGPAHQFMFTKETAMAYTEYSVIKTNTKGKKQPRIIGVDATNVYNKHLPSTKTKRRVSFDKVAHPFRPINTIVECEIAKDDPQSFTLVFRDPASGILKALHYQTETKMECAEIVAKIQFLRTMPINKPPS